MYIFAMPSQPHASFNCIHCAQIVIVEENDRYLLEAEAVELSCPGCGGVNQASSRYLQSQLDRDRENNGFYASSQEFKIS